jgi:hypothetical protein
VRLLWALLFIAGASDGCAKRDPGSPEPVADAGPDGGPLEGGMTFGESPCGVCVAQACAGPIAACADEPECVAYLACLDQCGLADDGNVDEACAAACPTGDSTSARQDELAVAACRTGGPAATCGACGSDAGIADSIIHEHCPDKMGPYTCDTLIQDSCCEPAQACSNDPGCSAIVACASACPSDDNEVADAGFFLSCTEACVAQHATARAHFVAYLLCVNANCTDAPLCGGTPEPCRPCYNKYCAQQLFELLSAPGGIGLEYCITYFCPVTQSTSCPMNCLYQYPEASGPLNAFDACQSTYCSTACGVF